MELSFEVFGICFAQILIFTGDDDGFIPEFSLFNMIL